jgi:hypothetical protein
MVAAIGLKRESRGGVLEVVWALLGYPEIQSCCLKSSTIYIAKAISTRISATKKIGFHHQIRRHYQKLHLQIHHHHQKIYHQRQKNWVQSQSRREGVPVANMAVLVRKGVGVSYIP